MTETIERSENAADKLLTYGSVLVLADQYLDVCNYLDGIECTFEDTYLEELDSYLFSYGDPDVTIRRILIPISKREKRSKVVLLSTFKKHTNVVNLVN